MAVPVSQTAEGKQAELLEACRYGTWQDVLRLKRRGASLSCYDPEGRTPLHYACMGGNYHVAEKLLEGNNHRFMLLRKANDETPLLLASRLGHARLVGLFMQWGVPFSLGDNERGETALHVACQHGHDAVVKQLVKHRTADLNLRDDSFDAPIHKACRGGHVDSVLTLLKNDADVNARNAFKYTPLHQAVKDRNWMITMMLLSRNPDLSARDCSGRTPLHLACLHNDVGAAKMISSRATPNTKDFMGFTPLHSACEKGLAVLVKILLAAGADVDAVTKHGQTALYLASQKGYIDIVRLLLHYDAKVILPGALSAMTVAAERRHFEVWKIITDHNPLGWSVPKPTFVNKIMKNTSVSSAQRKVSQ
ncbi:uncharacterized protein LOC143297609 [Babylonia areolata]|uniref:uncharacterized protein LOC143297609 n=1 Tax=Babylonia areolata TaxID=304850 RepID=UPI003FD038AB